MFGGGYNQFNSPYATPSYSSYPSYSSPYASSYASPYASPFAPRYGAPSPYDAPTRGWGDAPSERRGVLDRVHGGFASVGSVTEGMARVTGLLDHNWQSLFMSFTSLVRLIEGFAVMKSEFWALLKGKCRLIFVFVSVSMSMCALY